MYSLILLALLPFTTLAAAETAPTATDSAQVTKLQEFLEAGLGPHRPTDREIENGYHELNQSLNHALISDYAYALVLLRHNHFDEAMKVLDGLREESEPAFALAWQASIWNHLTRRQYEAGYGQLVEFAKLTADTDQHWFQLGDAEANAHWMGKLVEGLGYEFTSGTQADTLHEARAEVETALSGPLKKEFLAGIDEARGFRRLLAGEDTGTQTAEDKQAAEELKRKQAETLDSKEKLKQTSEHKKEYFHSQLSDLDRSLSPLQQEYATLETRMASIEQSMMLLQRQQMAINLAQRQRQSMRRGGRGRSRSSGSRSSSSNSQLRQKYTQYRTQLQQTASAMQKVAGQAAPLLAQRQSLIHEHHKETGEMVKENRELDKLAKKLHKQQEDIVAKGTGHDGAELVRLQKRMNYFSTYAEFNFEKEKQKLIDCLRATQSQTD